MADMGGCASIYLGPRSLDGYPGHGGRRSDVAEGRRPGSHCLPRMHSPRSSFPHPFDQRYDPTTPDFIGGYSHIGRDHRALVAEGFPAVCHRVDESSARAGAGFPHLARHHETEQGKCQGHRHRKVT